jgi:predicted short-subunit dehydrogenase-like oxidoreductase (DUF2520 family)
MDTTSTRDPRTCAVIGPGRLGRALTAALGRGPTAPGAPTVPAGALSAGAPTAPRWTVAGPFGRDDAHRAASADVVLLCVPDAAIAAAAAALPPRRGRLVGHCSGATGLDVLLPHEGFSLHPLMTVTERGADLRGAGAAVDGATPRALEAARSLAAAVGLRAVRVAPEDRAAYHAAASVASNLLVTLEAAAERLAASAGVDRALLVPLVRATVENWAAHGPEAALTGPVARGDKETVARQRQAVADRAPDVVEAFDVLVEATRALAGRPSRPTGALAEVAPA